MARAAGAGLACVRQVARLVATPAMSERVQGGLAAVALVSIAVIESGIASRDAARACVAAGARVRQQTRATARTAMKERIERRLAAVPGQAIAVPVARIASRDLADAAVAAAAGSRWHTGNVAATAACARVERPLAPVDWIPIAVAEARLASKGLTASGGAGCQRVSDGACIPTSPTMVQA